MGQSQESTHISRQNDMPERIVTVLLSIDHISAELADQQTYNKQEDLVTIQCALSFATSTMFNSAKQRFSSVNPRKIIHKRKDRQHIEDP